MSPPNSVFVQDGIHDRLVEAVQRRVGHDLQYKPFDHPEAIMGSLINTAAADKAERLVPRTRSRRAQRA